MPAPTPRLPGGVVRYVASAMAYAVPTLPTLHVSCTGLFDAGLAWTFDGEKWAAREGGRRQAPPTGAPA
ncbi:MULTISPECIES: hypothetical protein [Pseudomonas]|uniref:Uncharacterized protein n=1 Tax=Pseudomonas quercus TaxID=2722792 RepID=A0ABX0YK51_9PSED|nr:MULTISPECIES: hypothetical protein [Pseudomonas]MBF7143219.1 hypothetical protein [Pseudomonas sp. LY10J]NJP03396.1 hypothetical protein [Pseudomonas quercus]